MFSILPVTLIDYGAKAGANSRQAGRAPYRSSLTRYGGLTHPAGKAALCATSCSAGCPIRSLAQLPGGRIHGTLVGGQL